MQKIAEKKHILREKIYFCSVVTLLSALLSAYMYFVSASVVHVVIRKEVGKEIALMQSEISNLETEYIEKQHSMSTEVAELQGFVRAPDKIYIDRTVGSLVLSTDDL